MSHSYALSERYLLCRVTFTFLQRLARGWHSACRSHEGSTGVFRSNQFSVPTYLSFFFVQNMHVMHTCPCIYESTNVTNLWGKL